MGVMSLVGVNCIHAGICLMFYSSHFLLVRSHLCPNLSFNPTDLKILKPDKSDYIGVISRWCLGKYKSQKPSHKFDNFLSFKVIIKSNDFKNKMFDPDIKSDWNTHLWNLVILCRDLKTASINIEKFLVCFPLSYMDCYMYPKSKVRKWMHFKGSRHPMNFTF